MSGGPVPASLELARRACGIRHGLVDPPVAIPLGAADVPGHHHASVALEGRSGGGGTSLDPDLAAEAAVAEAVERWVAAYAQIPTRPASETDPSRTLRLARFSLLDADQQARPDLPHQLRPLADEPVAEVFDLRTNERWWAPAALITLAGDHGALPTSSGLAAAPTVHRALLRAVEELIERDAFVTTWQHQLGGRRVAAPEVDACVGAVAGASVDVWDLTPAWSPHPVAGVTGCVPLAGRPRFSLGLACRATWRDAVAKALAEFLQGTMFIAHHLQLHPELVGMRADEVTDFDRHAVFHSASPQHWADLPLHRWSVDAAAHPDASPALDDADQLEALLAATADAGIGFWYRELTSVDAFQLGLRVVRVLAPDLTPLHHDHRWPYLGGRARDVAWRYPDAHRRRDPGAAYPSPHPHPLG